MVVRSSEAHDNYRVRGVLCRRYRGVEALALARDKHLGKCQNKDHSN